MKYIQAKRNSEVPFCEKWPGLLIGVAFRKVVPDLGVATAPQGNGRHHVPPCGEVQSAGEGRTVVMVLLGSCDCRPRKKRKVGLARWQLEMLKNPGTLRHCRRASPKTQFHDWGFHEPRSDVTTSIILSLPCYYPVVSLLLSKGWEPQL